MDNVVHLHPFVVSATVNGLKSRPYGFSDAEAPARFILSLLETYEQVDIEVLIKGEPVDWLIIGGELVAKQSRKQVRSMK